MCIDVSGERIVSIFSVKQQEETSAKYLTLKMEATYSSETSDIFKRNTQRYASEDRNFPCHFVRMERFYNIPIEFGFTVKLVRLIKVCFSETYSTVSKVNIFPCIPYW
jgi:hypothetical protein